MPDPHSEMPLGSSFRSPSFPCVKKSVLLEGEQTVVHIVLWTASIFPLAGGSETTMPDWLELILSQNLRVLEGAVGWEAWDAPAGACLHRDCCQHEVRMTTASLGLASSAPNDEGALPPRWVLS